jgi:4-amino-4-deoxy-L-arabinose transferase-like glycosyltransferase
MPESTSSFARLPKTVCCLLALALVLRLLPWCGGLADSARFLDPDSHDYLRLAQSLVQSGTYGTPAQPEIFRAPGYPAVLAGLSVVTHQPWLVCLLQALLDVGSCALLWRLARRQWGETAATATLFFQACSVVSIVQCCRVLSETGFVFALLVFLNLLLIPADLSRRRSLLRGAASGLVLAVMTYLRAVAIPFTLLPVAYLLWRRRFGTALAMLGTAAVLLAPWVVRNARQTGYPHFSSVGAVNLYRYNACLLLAERNGIGFAEQQGKIDAEFARLGSQQAIANYAAKEGVKAILSCPVRYAWLHLKTVPTNLLPATGDLLRTFGVEIGGSGTLQVIRTQGLVAGVRHYFHGQWLWLLVMLPALALLGLLYLLAATGAVTRLLEHKVTAFDVFLVVTLLYFLAVPGGAAHPRFRTPIMPILAILAGVGWRATLGWRLPRVKMRAEEGNDEPA